MAISIHPPLGFTFQGQRDNNEDSIYPAVGQATPQNRFFIVCDGVGGAQKGELASRIAVESFANYFDKYPSLLFSEADLNAAFNATQAQFDAVLEAQHLLRGMATTFTFVGFHDQGATLAHIGDSRIYQIRNGNIVFKSEDHSKVNYLLKSGMITPEQARTHPERNVIMRAIQGSHRETELEINHLSDVQAGDYFFQCTDGVLENVTDEALGQILLSEQENSAKLQLLLNLCEGNTRDNYSGYLVQVATINDETTDAAWLEAIQSVGFDTPESTNPIFKTNASATFTESTAVPIKPIEKGAGLWFLGVFLVLAVSGGVYWYMNPTSNSIDEPNETPKNAFTKVTNLKVSNNFDVAQEVSPSKMVTALPRVAKNPRLSEAEITVNASKDSITPNPVVMGKIKDTLQKRFEE